jgi:hypothetical protein
MSATNTAQQATQEAAKPLAYSYVRFSTPEQAKGASYERQMELAQAYARERGWELAETTYKDLGVSAYRHKNAETGALRAFLKAVEQGDVPRGSYLLVKSLDRVTRNSILDAQALFVLIINSGITLVTLSDRRGVFAGEYHRQSHRVDRLNCHYDAGTRGECNQIPAGHRCLREKT